MKIVIIGSGNVAYALGKKLKEAGHQVIFAVRDIQSPKALKLKEQLPDATLLPVSSQALAAEVLILTTPAEAVLSLIPQLGEPGDRVMIDATNAVRQKPEPYPTAYHAIQAETGWKHLVKCFNTTGFENMLNPNYDGQRLDLFFAGDDPEAKQIARDLATDIGFDQCYDFGGSDKVELLEKWALCWINLAIFQGYGRDIGIKVLKRSGQ
ncbi:MAG TPA: NAD(P)-binding domain-containing protein [Saprospiraceae bacterium]|nr:NAD(P)-binding domain-containing protein [Saprospiraceae bacterium]